MAIEISTAEQFMAIRDWTDRGTVDVPLEIIITADLDFSTIDNFAGLGNTVLYANLDGQGHIIKNIVTYCKNDEDFTVLGCIYGNVKNIIIDNCNITTITSQYREFYWFYGSNSYTTIENIIIKNTNKVYSISYIRFFSGYKEANHIAVGGTYQTNSNRYGVINPFNGTLTKNSYTNCKMICYSGCGFLYGTNYAYNCFARNEVTASAGFGGFSTYNNNGRVRFCYAANTYTTDMSGNFYGFAPDQHDTCYFDKDIITISTVPKDLELSGQPTENLQSAEWLRAQGWAI